LIGSLLSCRIIGFLLIRVGICLLAISLVHKYLDEGVRRKLVDRLLEMAGKRGRHVGKRRRKEGGEEEEEVKGDIR
jgi:hypothetical protein